VVVGEEGRGSAEEDAEGGGHAGGRVAERHASL